MSQRPHRISVLALPAVLPLELGAATQIFGRDPYYQLTVCAEGRSVSLPGSGLIINTPAGLEGLKRVDTVIIPGHEDVDATVWTATSTPYVRHTPEALDWYRSAPPLLPSPAKTKDAQWTAQFRATPIHSSFFTTAPLLSAGHTVASPRARL